MCGICGKLNFDPTNNISSALLTRMADAIRHRGPDDEGYYVSGSMGLGFRRLSIIDLNTGHQPVANEDGTIWLVFNGEIYNYQELRKYLLSKGHVFSTQTDTEVIVHLYEEFGESCLKKLRGMFAFALWDDRQKILLLARDRLGIKPLYYWLSEKSLIFASEIKAILADPEVKRQLAPEMIDRFLTFYYLPGSETLFRNILRLAPGSYMIVKEGRAVTKHYWDLCFSPTEMSLRDAEARLEALFEESVRLHMISDVPVGFLLSGGIDSTAMLAFAVGKTDRAVSTFTLGFAEPNITDERPYASLAANRYQTEHHEMTISSKEFADFLPQFVWHMEEPACEPQAIALYYVSKLAKGFVKVLISGEGGDEAFAGYQNYRSMLWLERLKRVLKPFNGTFSSGLTALNRCLRSRKLDKFAPLINIPLEAYYYSRTSTPGTFFNRHKSALYSEEFAQYANAEFSASAATRYLSNGHGNGTINKMLYVDTKTFLPDDLLLKADKMTMANSVELRVPLLDHELLEFAARLPENFKVRGFVTKYVAKRMLKRRVPGEILNRRKAGFPVPYETWLRADLKDWTSDILLDPNAQTRNYFKRSSLEELIRENTRSQRHSKEVLSLVVLELWHRTFLRNPVN